MKVSIKRRQPLQPRTIEAIQREATKRGAFASPVSGPRGTDEVFLYRDLKLQASISRPAQGGIAFWRHATGTVGATVGESSAMTICRTVIETVADDHPTLHGSSAQWFSA
jgi:hypothetical protein